MTISPESCTTNRSSGKHVVDGDWGGAIGDIYNFPVEGKMMQDLWVLYSDASAPGRKLFANIFLRFLCIHIYYVRRHQKGQNDLGIDEQLSPNKQSSHQQFLSP